MQQANKAWKQNKPKGFVEGNIFSRMTVLIISSTNQLLLNNTFLPILLKLYFLKYQTFYPFFHYVEFCHYPYLLFLIRFE